MWGSLAPQHFNSINSFPHVILHGLLDKRQIMKISVKHYEEEITIENKRDDLTFIEFMDMIKRLSISMYSEKLVNEYWES